MRPVGFGICGLGVIADFHARAIAALEGARLVGVASRDPAKAAGFAARHGGVGASDLDGLLARPELDVVCVTTASGAHLGPALAAIRAGKHVVIEKPIEITLARVDEILAAAREKGVWVVPIFQNRFGEGALTVRRALEEGRLGRLVLASAHVKWHRGAGYYSAPRGLQAHDGGGALMNQAIHGLDLLQWFAGPPREVFCWTTRRVHEAIEVEDTAGAALRFDDGTLGTVEATTALWPGWERRLEICGENGSIRLDDDRITRWDFRDGRPGDAAVRASGEGATGGSGASSPTAIGVAGHRRQLQDLVDAMRSGGRPALLGEEGRKAVALVCALYASARSGRPETVNRRS
jgi:UDP-N-acetyl-2-amino-2-deoxyglucuronate dehydrogenase